MGAMAVADDWAQAERRARLRAAGVHMPDDLDQRLDDIDRLRVGPKTPLDEVERRCMVLLAQFGTPEQQARIYYQWAHVEAQSGLQRPQKVIELVTKALGLPLDTERRLQLYAYWGKSIEASNRGVRGDAMMAVRREAVVPYLRGLAEAVAVVTTTENSPLPPDLPMQGRDMVMHAESTARSYAKWSQERHLERYRRYRDGLEGEISYLYSRSPFATREIEVLATQLLPDGVAINRLIAKVRIAVQDREAQIRQERKKQSKALRVAAVQNANAAQQLMTAKSLRQRLKMGFAAIGLVLLVPLAAWRWRKRATGNKGRVPAKRKC